jgi:phospholipid/cholesterol/gamma-HCH transport system substrate-binding protein
LNAIIANMRSLSENLRAMADRNRINVDTTLNNMADITDKVNKGEGTLGRLVNDDETVDKVNESLDNLNGLLGGANRMKLELGYHGEYLTRTQNVKNYVSLALRPRPDKAFLLEMVNDPSPPPTHRTKKSEITSGGVTTTVVEKTETTSPDKFRFSAEFAKKFYNLTLRGGIIESTGGVGIDYDQGPVGVQLSAFDFGKHSDRRPHLKALGKVNMSKSVFLLGGADDFISRSQPIDWFMGAGFTMTDDDIKSLLGFMNVKK